MSFALKEIQEHLTKLINSIFLHDNSSIKTGLTNFRVNRSYFLTQSSNFTL